MATEQARRVGRPRNTNRRLTRAPDHEIVYQAARLFGQKGFAATSTREIAEAAGLQQSGLFHYFPTKVDILVAISELLHIKPLAILERIEMEPGSPGAKIFRLAYGETHLACLDQLLFRAVLESSVSLVWARFRKYHSDEQRHRTGVMTLIASGVGSGDFVDEDPFLATMRYAGMVNWLLKWYRVDGGFSAAEIAEDFARSYLRSLLSDTALLDGLEAEARELGLPIVAPTLR